MTEYQTKDSGKREEMDTGSVRDSRENKGRFDLISPFAEKRLAGVYERGSVKYNSRNWEKGQPFSRCLDSAKRHLNSFALGMTDEDHLAQALWNIAAMIHFEEAIKLRILPATLDDMPKYVQQPGLSAIDEAMRLDMEIESDRREASRHRAALAKALAEVNEPCDGPAG